MTIIKSKNTLFIGLVLLFFSLMASCHSGDPKVQENNKATEVFNDTELYPDQKTAYTKKQNTVLFYAPTSDHTLYLETNLNTRLLTLQDPETMNITGLLKINDFKYILPKKYADFYKFALGATGTGGGDFFTHIEYNGLGLIKSMERNFPEGKNKYLYQYNKYGQLLKLIEERTLLNKVLLENTYDEKSRLIFQKRDYEDYKSEKNWVYDKNNRVQKETAWEKEIAPNGNIIKDETKTFFYEYDHKGQLVKKYTQNRNDIIEYTYNNEHQLVSTLEYSGTIEKDHPEEIMNYFIKKTYAYLNDEVIEALRYEYKITNYNVLVNGKWEAISIEEQKKKAWEKLKEQSAVPLQIIETKYAYQPSEINITTNKFHLSTTYNNGQIGQRKELADSDSMKYILDSKGRIIKKETYHNKDADNVETQEIFY